MAEETTWMVKQHSNGKYVTWPVPKRAEAELARTDVIHDAMKEPAGLTELDETELGNYIAGHPPHA